MKILAIAPVEMGNLGFSFINGFSRLGHEVISLDYRQTILSRGINGLEELIKKSQGDVDLCFILKGEHINPDIFNIPTLFYYPDEISRYTWEFTSVYQKYTHAFVGDPNSPKDTIYSPVGIDLSIYHPCVQVEKDVLISFVGTGRADRSELLSRLYKRYRKNLRVYGNNWNTKSSFYTGKPLYFEDMINQFARSKWIFNCTTGEGINSRVLETMAIKGGILITNRTPAAEEYFRNNKHLFFYDSIEDIFEIISYFDNNQEHLEKIKETAYQEVVKNHTIEKRISEMLKYYD